MQPYYLTYDIPERSAIPNPSPRLRRFAVRINLSCWVVLEDQIPYHLLAELTEAGANCYLVKFAADEAAKLITLAADALRRDTAEAIRRAELSVRRADAAADLTAEADPAAALDAYLRRTRALVRRTQKLVADFQKAASVFGIAAERLTLTDALRSVNAIQAATMTRARLYAEMARELAWRDAALAAAAEADEVPAGILADRLEDAGVDCSAARLAFTDAAA